MRTPRKRPMFKRTVTAVLRRVRSFSLLFVGTVAPLVQWAKTMSRETLGKANLVLSNVVYVVAVAIFGTTLNGTLSLCRQWTRLLTVLHKSGLFERICVILRFPRRVVPTSLTTRLRRNLVSPIIARVRRFLSIVVGIRELVQTTIG